MKLILDLERAVSAEESLFRQQLLREDVRRLRTLEELARSARDLDDFCKAGMRLGWTQGDARTHELREPLEPLLKEIFSFVREDGGAGREARIVAAWNALHHVRMERLLGCLSTPVPKPAE